MKYIKSIGISLLTLFLSYIILTLIMTILSFSNIINNSVLSFFKIAILFISIFISSFTLGKSINNKIVLYSGLYGLGICICLTLTNLIIYKSLFKGFYIYFLIIIITSILGAISRFKTKTKS